MTQEHAKQVKKALQNAMAFIEGMMEVGAIPVTLAKLSSDVHTQIQEAEKVVDLQIL